MPGIAAALNSVEITETDRDSLRISKSRDISTIRESGAHHYKSGICAAADTYQALFDIAVYFIAKGTPSPEIIGALSGKNKALKSGQYSFEELQSIKSEAYTYYEWIKQQTLNTENAGNETPNDIKKAAEQIIKSGTIKDEFIKQFRRFHAGDEKVAHVILYGYAVQALTEPDVIIHPLTDGELGSGKSSATDAALHLLPQEWIQSTRFSSKSLFYETIPERSILCLDDSIRDKDFESSLKSYMNNVSRVTTYTTLDKDRNPVKKSFPRICMIIMSSVEDPGDDQLLSRMYRINVTSDPDKRKRHHEIIKNELATGEDQRLIIDDDVLVIREALRVFRQYKMKVTMPDAVDHLRFTDNETGSRDPEMFKRFLKGACILNFAQRDYVIDGDVMTIISVGEHYKKDLADANAVFNVNQKQRKYRLTGTEEKVLSWIIKITSELNPLHETDLNEISEKSGIAYKTVYNAIFGTSAGVGGLKAKIPGLKIEDVSIKIENTTTRKKLITMSKTSNKAGDGYWGSGQFAYYE